MPTDPSTPAACARRENSHPGRDLAGILCLSLLLLPALSLARQQGDQAAKPQREEQPNRRAEGGPQQPRPGQGGFFQRLRELPPDQQRRVMENNPRFQHMSPEQQEMIRERLRRWNAMTPQQKETIREREEILQGLSPAQRQEARAVYFQYRDLTPGRRQAVAVAFRHLRDLPPDQRRAFLDSQRVREQFSPHEREVLEGLNKLLSNSRPGAPDNSDQ